MFLLSLLIPVAYIPGITGASMATGWVVMSAGLPVVTWKGGGKLSSPIPIFLGLLFCLYAFVSTQWVNNPETAVSTLWQYALMGLAFWAGTQREDLRPLAIGLAIGFGISSLLSLAQALGFDAIIEYIPCRPSGLMFNPIILGEGCALTILLCLAYRLPWLALALAPGLVLSQSRAAFLALAVGLTLQYCKPQRGTLWALSCPLTFAALIAHDTSDNFRWLVWRVLWHFTDLLGHGAGSVEAVLIHFNGHMYAPGYAHNEFLDLAYQYGLGSTPAALLLLLPATMVGRDAWPAYCAFAICLAFSFPLHSPPLAFAGMVVAGYLARDWSWARVFGDHRGRWSLSWLAHVRSGDSLMAV